MKDDLSAGQYLDWLQFARQFCIDFNRDDVHWAQSRADFLNANRGENSPTLRAIDLMPYHDPLDDDVSDEELMARIKGA